MKRYSINEYGYHHISTESISDCKAMQDPKLIAIMEKKAEALAANYNFASYPERLLFIDAFMKGYICAFIVNDEQEEIERELTPLGKALKEE